MNDKPVFNVDQIDDGVFVNMANRRANEAETHWNKEYRLSTIRDDNRKLYLASYIEEQIIDERYQEIYSDNRIFVDARVLLPFLTGRLTAPEVTPANNDDSSVQFARDFEDAMWRHADKQMGRGKTRLAIQDLLAGQRVGVLKWRYNATVDNVCLEYIAPKNIIIGKRSKLYEEPDFVRHTQERAIGDLVRQFPKKEKQILDLFGVTRGVPSQLERLVMVNEDWLWTEVNGEPTLIVGWSHSGTCFGKMTDPNFDEGGNNLLERPMMPFVFFNFLNDGSGYIDNTSFIEQSKYSQKNYNKRGQTIAESAKYGGTGVPIFAKGSIPQKDVSKIHFSPIQRVLLDTQDVTKAFTTWQSSPLQPYVIEDQKNLADSIDNIWGTPDVLKGEMTMNDTLGQDILNRDRAEGRHADPIDCIDYAMTRFYQLEAQLMYRYFDSKRFYNYIGDDGKFVSIIVSQAQLRQNLGIEINVKAGSSLPIDRAQRRATMLDLLKAGKVSTLLAYKELNLFERPEEAYQQLIKESLNPIATMNDLSDALKSREAEQDLQAVIAGEKPVDREDYDQNYLVHLTEWLNTNKYHMLEAKDAKAAARVRQFVQEVINIVKLKETKLNQQAPNENAMPPLMPHASEVINYRDVPPDVQAQMEARRGYQPSELHDEEVQGGLARVGANSATIVQPQPNPVPVQPTPAGMPQQ